MENDFPTYIFADHTKTIDASQDKEFKKYSISPSLNKNPYANSEEVIKLNYRAPVIITFDENENNFKCLTQKFFASDFLKQITTLHPWNLPKKFNGKYGILYLNN